MGYEEFLQAVENDNYCSHLYLALQQDFSLYNLELSAQSYETHPSLPNRAGTLASGTMK